MKSRCLASALLLCAWVLWSKTTSLDPPVETTWGIVTATEARADCLAHPLAQSGPTHLDAQGKVIQPMQLGGIQIQLQGARTVIYECLPDTVDPRGSKR